MEGMKKTCTAYEEVIQQYLDGMEDEMPEELSTHLTSCGECRRAIGEYRQLKSRLDSLPLIAPPDDMASNIMSLLPANKSDKVTCRGVVQGFFNPILSFRPAFISALFIVIMGVIIGTDQRLYSNCIAGFSLLHIQASDLLTRWGGIFLSARQCVEEMLSSMSWTFSHSACALLFKSSILPASPHIPSSLAIIISLILLGALLMYNIVMVKYTENGGKKICSV